MLKNILTIIERDGCISKTQIAGELNLDKEIVNEGINQLMRMNYLLEDNADEDCASFCSNCPYAKTCGKKIPKTFKISDKGNKYLKNQV